jgi:uncharacterized membrane protein
LSKNRLEAFSDGVLAIVITIMVLELHAPEGAAFSDFAHTIPGLLTYLLSFVFIGIYWNNHHHMLHTAQRVNGTILWANLHLLFWLSLVPFATAYASQTRYAELPTALYGLVFLFSAIAYFILQRALIHHHGNGSRLSIAVGPDLKGKLSLALYSLGIGAAFVLPWVSYLLYITVAVVWLIPDRRIEQLEDFTGQS